MDDLLDYLAGEPGDGRWRQWKIRRIGGSANNILYRASGPDADWAVKFTIRDARRRAFREYTALQALQEAGVPAPRPIFLAEDRYPQPVVVQSWETGEVTAVPPQTDADWLKLLSHLAAIHTVTPERVTAPVATAVINFGSIAQGKQFIRGEMVRIPPAEQPAALQALVRRAYAQPEPDWGKVPTALCRVDANTLNFLRREEGWLSVDWENSGWGDPAFEMVDMMTHPQFAGTPRPRWEWAVAQYARLTGEETAVARIQAYHPLMVVWWAARLARMLYETPRGLDERLAQRPSGWQEQITANYHAYLRQGSSLLAKWDL